MGQKGKERETGRQIGKKGKERETGRQIGRESETGRKKEKERIRFWTPHRRSLEAKHVVGASDIYLPLRNTWGQVSPYNTFSIT